MVWHKIKVKILSLSFFFSRVGLLQSQYRLLNIILSSIQVLGPSSPGFLVRQELSFIPPASYSHTKCYLPANFYFFTDQPHVSCSKVLKIWKIPQRGKLAHRCRAHSNKRLVSLSAWPLKFWLLWSSPVPPKSFCFVLYFIQLFCLFLVWVLTC